MKTKKRHLKTFNEKFMISGELTPKKDMYALIKHLKMEVNKITIKDILLEIQKYLGVFYISPTDAQHLLNLNLEDVYTDVVKLNKQEHHDDAWAYDNDEFQKVYVLENNGKKANILILYNNAFNPYFIETVPTKFIEFDGNVFKGYI